MIRVDCDILVLASRSPEWPITQNGRWLKSFISNPDAVSCEHAIPSALEVSEMLLYLSVLFKSAWTHETHPSAETNSYVLLEKLLHDGSNPWNKCFPRILALNNRASVKRLRPESDQENQRRGFSHTLIRAAELNMSELCLRACVCVCVNMSMSLPGYTLPQPIRDVRWGHMLRVLWGLAIIW